MVFSSNELDMLILQNGEDGIPADSKYIWVKYSQNANGIPLTDNPTNAVYIGIAYNKDSIEESNNPSDYFWSKILGDKGDDAYTIILSNENISFSVSYENNLAIGDQSFTTDVRVFYGADERDDFVIGEIGSSNGITVSKTVNSVTLSVTDNTKITAKHGYFRIPISIDGMIFYKDMSWNTVPQGAPGSVGQPALNVSLGNESQNIPCNSEGVTLESFLIEIPFAAYEGFNKVACTASVGVLPSGITLGQNTGSTPDEDGLIILNVARGSNLGGDEVLQGKVVITFIIGESEVTKNFTWTKTKDGATGEAGQFTLYSLESSAPVISKTFDDTFSPESITFSAYSMEGNSGDKTEYSGMFIIEESTNGTTYDTSYLSSADEQSVTFTPTSINVISIRCTLYKAGGITSALDIYTVPVLTDVDNMRPIIDEITTSISGVESKVDSVEKSITDKVWQSDITTQINNYDNTTVKIIRDQVAETQTSLGEIRSTVSDVQTTLTTKADGSTVQTLSEKVSNIEQDANGFKQTVEKNYVTNDDLDENSKTLRSEFNQTASEINQTVTDLSGDVTTITQNVASINQKVADAEGNISSLQQTSNSLQSQIETAQGDISNIQQTAGGLQSQITDNKNNISQLEQNVEGFKTTVSSQLGALESTIEQTAQDIELSVSEVADNLKNNYYNKTQTDALIKVEADKITSTVSRVETVETTLKKTVKSNVEEFYLSTSHTALSGGSWSTTQPTWTDGKYIWRRTKVTYTDGTTSYTPSTNGVCITGSTGATGATGKGVSSITEEYYLSTSKTTQTGGSWTTKPPTWSSGKYIWTRSKIVYTNPSSTVYTTPVCDSSWEAVNEIEVGGRNYVIGSSDSWSQWITPGVGTNKTHAITIVDFATLNLSYDDYISLQVEWEGENFEASEEGTTKIWSQGAVNGVWNGDNYFSNPWGLVMPNLERPFDELNSVQRYTYTYLVPDTTINKINSIGGKVQLGFRVDNANAEARYRYRRIKIEKGNRVTEWTPAPEDMATAEEVENAQNSANQAQSVADATESRVTIAESTIQQLSDSIAMLVVDENGESMMTQTSEGWRFDMGSINSQLSNAANKLNDLAGDMAQADQTIQGLNDLANDIAEKTAYIVMTTDDSGAPCIELGKSDNPFKVRITNTSIDFMQGSSRIAYIDNQSLYIERAVIKNELQIGDGSGFIWKKRNNGHLGLRWVGGAS